MLYSLRTATLQDAAGIARVNVDAWRSAYQGIIPAEYLASLRYEQREAAVRQRMQAAPPTEYMVAVDDQDAVIGFAVGGPERDHFPGHPGELYAIYILPERQGQGIGRLLMRVIFANLEQAGLKPAIIWALEQNPACAFYRRLGGVPVGEKWIEIGGRQLKEIGFSYQNLVV